MKNDDDTLCDVHISKKAKLAIPAGAVEKENHEYSNAIGKGSVD